MALTRTDENELLTALHEGLHEEPRWRTFLDRLRGRTRADYAALIFGQGDTPMHHATELFSGRNLRAEALRLGELARLDPIRYEQLRPGRVYSAEEMIDPADVRHDRFRREYLERIGVRYGRFMRVSEPGGTSAWAILSREKNDFVAADGAVLAALAPHLTIALRNFATLERERFRANIAGGVLARAGIGWSALDADGRVVAASPGIRPLLSAGGTRLTGGSADAERAIQRASEGFAGRRDRTPEAIRLDDEDQTGLLALPVPDRPLATLALPVMLALARSERPLKPLHATLLAKLYDLSMSEARLAILLAEGQSIAEAAETLGLTLETARNYSKRLYAKTGTRGQADLVRLVLTSVAVLA